MLAGDADRDRVAEVLKDAFAEGRLTQGEYEERIERLYRARTYRELDVLVSDVPRPMPFRPPVTGSSRTNAYAVASLVCGIAGTFLGLPAVPAVVLGHISRRQIRRTGEQGDGLAVAGLVLGYLVSAVMLVFLTLFVVLLVVVAQDPG
ncbi:DUF1707 and DUF4190 domain-containing protein [Actinacidiphila acidipaludis]|uniref:DUF1707 and DUF4190 domain-containing protein n=1 Tax=Actinacidiphila acidipaludis TaxID=2873382 RepID=A0ABS7Q4H5_9ACTN|nr:DUF1707 and DUF4190 domain-containing protein [Streptomyces acidipaludis]MBY8878061.1 DUF1707 and DUF4190 domain-containing protein [Streptomyces acidipaludis]